MLFNFTNSSYLSDSICIMCAKDNGTVAKFRLHKYLLYDKRPVEHATLLFSVFSFLQQWHVFCQKDEFPKFYYVTKFYDLKTFHSKIAVCYLLFLNLNSGNMNYFISLISRICANGCYINLQFTKICLFGIFILPTLKFCRKFYEKTFFRRMPF